MPVPVLLIWIIIAILLGSLAGITAYFLSNAVVLTLAIIGTLVLVGVLFPAMPELIRKTREISAALKNKTKSPEADDEDNDKTHPR